MIEKMSKIQVIAPRSIMSELLQTVSNFGYVQVDKVENPLGEGDEAGKLLKPAQLTGEAAEKKSKLEDISKKIEEINALLKEDASAGGHGEKAHAAEGHEHGAADEKDNDLKKLQGELEECTVRSGLIKKIQKKVADNLKIYSEVDKFAETKFSFIIFGWILSEKLEEFKETIKKAYGTQVIVEELHIKEEEYKKVPVSLKNNSYAKRFEVCLSAFPSQTYGGIDPTLVLSIFFPMIFGMILGDIGYGLLVLLFALWIKGKGKTNKALDDVGYVMTVCALSSVAFGFLYGEVFGTLGYIFGLHPILVNREDIPGLIWPFALSIGFGVFHMLLAFTLKAVSAYRHHNKINAHVVEAVSTISIVLGLVGIVLCKTGVLASGLSAVFGAIAGVAFVALWVSGGIAGGLEIFGTMGNILSYARIMAIGMQSVIMAMVANIIVVKSPNKAFGIVLCLLIHAINLLLGVVGPTIHGLRLHFVETFTKYVKFEGVKYQPSGRGGEEVA